MATATRTVLFTDLADFTKKVGQADREGLHKLLEDHEQFVRPLLLQRGGRIIKMLGDAYVVLFDSATDAVHAGREVIEKVAQGGTLVIRVSCVTGDVEEIHNDAFGDAVNLAARINSRTPAGECWFSESSRLCMKQTEIPWESVGQFTLKGIPGETMCYRVVGKTRCWLPAPIKDAVKAGNLCRIKHGAPIPALPPDPIVLFEGFQPGSAELRRAVDSLPVLDPARLWLSTWLISPDHRFEWMTSGHGLLVGTPQAVERAFEEVKAADSKPSGSNTIILDLGSTAELDLVMAGLALPAVPMAEVVAGYTYDLLHDGRWVNRSDQPVLRVDVSQDGVRMKAMTSGVAVDGRSVPSNQFTTLKHGMVLSTPSGSIRFHHLANAPYAGILVSEDRPLRMGVALGQVTELGREPNHPGLQLPDRRGQENIRWCAGPRAARAREGGFTLDRALAGRHQAQIEVDRGGTCNVRALHPRCPTYIYNETDPLKRVEPVAPIKTGDLIVTGTTVVGLRPPQR
ncbi:MAG: adenylate/guanylate cyclase domain-containing protein [Alphaproteobacteria bacterium]|nr:adenylate/guanylate cyclase domain-containing protein [Alphaproteobacteria bacterium]